MRDLGLLDVASFNALPLRSQDFPPESLFRPVYDLVREALKTQRLLPAHGDEYICASAAKLARVRELVELFSGKQLSQLFCHEDLRWLDASITANGETADLHTFLLGLVDGVQVTPGTVAQKMTVDFFAMQTDEWLIQFYMYAGKNYDAFKDRPFVRLENGDCVLSGSLEKPNAYLPPANASCIDQAIFPLVKHSVASHQESKKFLVDKVRLREPDRIDVVIRSILPNYLAPAAHIELSKYLVDLEEIANAFLESTPENATRLIEKLKEAHFVAAVPASNPQGETVWIKPDNPTLYRRSAELEMWFAGNTSDIAWFPVAVANDNLPDALQKRLKFTQGSLLRYEPATPKREPPVRWDSKEGIYRRLEGGFDAYAEIFGLHWAVKTPSSQRAVFLWKILVAHVNLIKGTERRSGNKQFPATSTTIFNGYSVLGKICTEHAWLPRHNAQNFHKPADLLLSELPDSFEKDTSRAELASRVLGMKQPVDFSSVASAYGITAEEVELRMALTPQEMIDIERQRAEKIRVSTLFDEVSPDPKRRAEKIAEEFSITPVKPSELRERTIDPDKPKAQDDARAYLAHEYTTDGVMICQLCGIKQPVVLNGEPQFEAVDCIKINKHSEYNKLALCPNHSVMYQRGVQSPDDVRFSILKCESLEIPLNLAGNEVKLKFTSKHLGDLRAALQTITSLAETQNADV